MNTPLIDLAHKLEKAHHQLHHLLERRLEATLEQRTVSRGNGFNQARQKELEPELLTLETRIEQAQLNLEYLKVQLRLLEIGGAA